MRTLSRSVALSLAAMCLAVVPGSVIVPARAADDPALAQKDLCTALNFEGADYTVCHIDPDQFQIATYLNGDDGKPLLHFDALAEKMAREGRDLVLAMNGGMYHRDRSPVGHYVEGGVASKPINTRPGPGNFHLLPNGVFFVQADGSAGVMESRRFKTRMAGRVDYATQSGPLLVINGALHARFIPGSTSRKRRNGVGVRSDGHVVLAISDGAVNFHQFARLFRDGLDCPDALFLDGTISRLYAPARGRDDPGLPMGPIIGVTLRDGS